jgi:hypothetical protein
MSLSTVTLKAYIYWLIWLATFETEKVKANVEGAPDDESPSGSVKPTRSDLE